MQREAGVTNDSADIFAHDIQAKARGTAAPHLVAAYTGADRAGAGRAAISPRPGVRAAGRLPVPRPQRAAHAHPAAAHRRRAGGGTRRGRRARRRDADDRRARVRAVGVTTTDRVIGVGYRRPDGAVGASGLRALLLACNGFGGNSGDGARTAPGDA